jgi:predicted metal-dependent phosphoesterase TrpH|tara:strand:+ start:321 stop:974 length:654 start_codon:yes stop_codon:yes gene_type:complete
MLIDIHTHTYPVSDDSLLDPEELVSQAKKVGLDGVCITDHDGFWDPKDIKKLSLKTDFLVIPGCEVTTEDGHLLVYGLKEYIFGMHKSDFVKDLVEEQGGAIVIAHPYRRVYREPTSENNFSYDQMIEKGLRNNALKLSDAVEINNGRGTKKENQFSADLAKKLNMPGTGASDAHKISDIGTYATRFYDQINDELDLIEALKKGRFQSEKVNTLFPK